MSRILSMLREVTHPNQEVLLITHGSCWDGFAAAWCFHRQFPGFEDPQVIFWNHSNQLPDKELWKNRLVFITDLMLPAEYILEASKEAKAVLILDYHKSAIPELKKLGMVDPGLASFARFSKEIHPGVPLEVNFTLKSSGARLAWQWLNQSIESPWIIDYVEDRDLWTWILPESRAINMGLRSLPFDFDKWDRLVDGRDGGWKYPYSWLIDRGTALLEYQETLIKSHVAHARRITFAGHQAKVVNCTGQTLISEVCEALLTDPEIAIAICYFIQNSESGNRMVLSLRSKEVDVGAIAQKKGGGGHRLAAGYSVDVTFPIGVFSVPEERVYRKWDDHAALPTFYDRMGGAALPADEQAAIDRANQMGGGS